MNILTLFSAFTWSRTFRHITLLLIFIVMRPSISFASLPSDSIQVPDTLKFAGFEWLIKDSHEHRTGPGTNLFSSSTDNVRVDEEGKLHLRITYRNDNWYCPEIHSVKSLGFGKYTFVVDALPQELDKDVVIGMFLYDHTDKANFHNEVDIEISKWGKTEYANTQYVVQPLEEKAHRFETDVTKQSHHTFNVYLRRTSYSSYYPGDSVSKFKPIKYAHHKQSLGRIYNPANAKTCINVWLYKAIEPANLKEFEVVISKFVFEPFEIPNP